ncbi:MAG: hypothetical protein ACK4RM_06145 [Flavobacterium sp.]
MKKIYLFLILISLNSCKKEKEEVSIEIKNDRLEFQLKGDVQKVVTEYLYENIDVSPLNIRFAKERNEEKTFDRAGRLTSHTTFNENGSIFEKRVYNGKSKLEEYQQFLNGNPFSITKYTWDEDHNNTISTKRDAEGNIIDKTINVFRNNQLVEKRNLRNKGTQLDQKITYEYDSEGLKTMELKYDRNEQLKSITKFVYNEKGLLISEVKSDPMGSYSIQSDFEYDVFDRMVYTRSHSNSSTLAEYEEMKEYDDKGNLLLVKITDHAANETFSEVFKYDEKQNAIEIRTYSNEELKRVIENLYDENGLLVESKTVNNDSRAQGTFNEYTFDAQGNWITKKVSIDGILVYQINRTITYF